MDVKTVLGYLVARCQIIQAFYICLGLLQPRYKLYLRHSHMATFGLYHVKLNLRVLPDATIAFEKPKVDASQSVFMIISNVVRNKNPFCL